MTVDEMIYLLNSLEMSKDNLHLKNFRANLREIAAKLRELEPLVSAADELANCVGHELDSVNTYTESAYAKYRALRGGG